MCHATARQKVVEEQTLLLLNYKSTMTGPANQSRIPSTLQAIFLASNRGKDVHRPPPKSVANKVYFGNFRFQNKGNAFKRFFGGKSKRNVAAPEAPKTQAPAAKVVEKEVKVRVFQPVPCARDSLLFPSPSLPKFTSI